MYANACNTFKYILYILASFHMFPKFVVHEKQQAISDNLVHGEDIQVDVSISPKTALYSDPTRNVFSMLALGRPILSARNPVGEMHARALRPQSVSIQKYFLSVESSRFHPLQSQHSLDPICLSETSSGDTLCFWRDFELAR